MVTQYTVVYGPTSWECQIEVDHGYVFESIKPGENWTINRAMLEMIKFWTGGEHRLNMNDGDVTKTFLHQLAREINYIQAEYHYNLIGVTGAFKNREGWWPMDGSRGIKILEVDDFEFSHSDYEVLEVPAENG